MSVEVPYRERNDLVLGGFVDRETMRFVRDWPEHPPARVWAALTDRVQLETWLWTCSAFEPRLGGVGVFNPGREIRLTVTEFEPPRLMNLGGAIRFHLEPLGAGCRLTLDLKRPPEGWSPMAMAGFHGWLGRLGRLLAGRDQAETETWAQGIWNAVIGHCEWEVRRWISGGEAPIWRVHFAENDSALTAEAAAQLDALAELLKRRGLAVTIDGFGDDPSLTDGADLRLCAARIASASAHLRARGVAAEAINVAFVLGNYHPMVERDCEAGRAFNRRVELRPAY